jgi:integrase
MAVFRKGENWYIDYRFKGKRLREKVGPSKKQAHQALAARKGEIAQGRFNLERVEKTPLLDEFIAEYLEYSRAHKKSSRRDSISTAHLSAFFKEHGIERLGDITPWHMEKYKLARKERVSNRTVDIELACLSHMFTMALKWGMVRTNPMKDVSTFGAKKNRIRFLEAHEIDRLLDSCDELLKPIVTTALQSGMRMQELLGLRWEDVDLANRVITLNETKSGKAQHVLVNSVLKELLCEHKASERGDYVFGGEEGLSDQRVRRMFQRVVKRAGIRDFRFHDLRHTFASHLVMSGWDIITVKELMRHSNITMTMKYAHLSRDHKRRAIESIYSGRQMDTEERIEATTNYAIRK